MGGGSFHKLPPVRGKAISDCSAYRNGSSGSAAGSMSTALQIRAPFCRLKSLSSRNGKVPSPRWRNFRNRMKKSEKIRVLIADDHYIVRIGLVTLVNAELDMEVVAEADDGVQALELFGRHNPDLVLLDMNMPVKNGVQTTVEILAKNPSARVIIITAFDGD